MSRRTPPPAEPSDAQSASSKLFDLRILIGGLFTVYGVVLVIAGLMASSAEMQKAAGVNINLWMGIGMALLGVLFLLWWRLQPLHVPADPAHEATPAPRGRR